MSASSTPAGTYSLEHRGKVYHVSPLTQSKKDEFSRLSKAKAVAAVVAARDALSPDDYSDAYSRVMECVGSGAFDFHTQFTARALQTHGGMLQLIRVLIGCSEEEAIRLMREKFEETKAALDVVLKESEIRADPPAAG